MQDAQTAIPNDEPLLGSADSLFGICQAIGDDIGFNPFWLRVALIGILFFSPLAAIGAYLALGAVVALSRLLFPKPHQAAEAEAIDAQEERNELPMAA